MKILHAKISGSNMTNFTPPEFESQSIENFLSQYYINQILETYRRIQKQIHKRYKMKYRLTEVYLPVERLTYELTIVYEDEVKREIETTVKTPANVKKYYKSLRNNIKKSFESKKTKLKLSKLCIHNLHSALSIHCDGLDLDNRFDDRPDSMIELEPRYTPKKFYDMYNQGLITLKNDNQFNGTVVFNQWFPYSTYIHNTIPYDNSARKNLIKFYKDEEWYRFGEEVRLKTKNEISIEDWNHLCNSVEDTNLLDKDVFFGFSIDKILFFGSPGTLSVWANKKYHASLPTKYWSSNRINLQFETYRVKKGIQNEI